MSRTRRSKSFNAKSLVRLYLLTHAARDRALADRAGGGGPSPYRHALKTVKRVVYEGLSIEEATAYLQTLHDEALIKASTALANRMLAELADVRGETIPPPRGEFWSPAGTFKITAQPDISIETDAQIIHYVFWNNKTAELYREPAQVLGYLFVQAVPADLLKRHVFRFVNLRTNNTYDVQIVTDAVKRDAENFLVAIENRYLKVQLRLMAKALAAQKVLEPTDSLTRH